MRGVMNQASQSFWPGLVSLVISILILFLIPYGKIHSLLIAEQGYVLLFALISFILLSLDSFSPVPSEPIVFLNALTLGFIPGLILSMVGFLSACSLGYLYGRHFPLDELFKRHVQHSKDRNQNLWIYTMLSRGIPALCEYYNFYNGYKRQTFSSFILTCAIGYIPWCILYSIAVPFQGRWLVYSSLVIVGIGVYIFSQRTAKSLIKNFK
jgi:uncharacterized membrane protein YdjX (TVP38/TMEM64 family)